jgi:RimJ/RimL family protein N-acetyltransferase
MRVALRRVEAADLPILFEYQRDSEANAMAAFPPRDRKAFDAHWKKILSDDAAIVRAVIADGEVAGNIGSWEQDGARLVGYWIGRARWGKGIATAALSAFVRDVDTGPLRAYVAKHNVGSIRVLEKCGFRSINSHVADDGVEEVLYAHD